MIKAQNIAEAFDVSLFDANLAILLIRYRINPELHFRRFPQTCRWLNSCYHPPRTIELILEALNELLGGHGVEAIQHEEIYVDRYHGNIVASYINTGDTYSPTILLDHIKNRWRLTTWGDFYESLPTSNSENFDD
jgi:hypothetical protein